VDAVVARLVICACALDHSWRLPTPLSPVHDGRAFTSAPLSPRFRGTAEGRGQNPNACLASALSLERNHYTPAYPRPRKQAFGRPQVAPPLPWGRFYAAREMKEATN
jgi:hypothetical protein